MNETFLGGHFQKFTGVIFIWSDGVDEDGVLDPAAPGLPSIEGMLGLPSFIFQ